MWGDIFQNTISLTGSFNFWLVLAIFLMTLIAEFGLSIPYMLETVWLLTGYHLSGGALTPASIVLFCVISLIGREIGASLLYRVSWFGNRPFRFLYGKLTAPQQSNTLMVTLVRRILLKIIRLVERLLAPRAQCSKGGKLTGTNLPDRILRISPFSVALARFTCLKLPVTITLGMNRQLIILLTGVGLFSLAWDGLYILIGLFGAGNKISPFVMLACTISSFFTIQLLVFFIRKYIKTKRVSVPA
jgi:membrane-associated protein